MPSLPAQKQQSEMGWNADPDVELMLRVRDGDHAAYRQLFSKYMEPLVNFAFRFVGSRGRAEELVQDAFLQIFRARERYEPRARFSTFVYRVTTNLCLNEVRRAEYQGRIEPLEGNPTDERGEGFREFEDVDRPTALEYVEGLDAADRIGQALAKLPPNQKSALLLSRVEGFSYQEVADTLETSISAVKSLIFRATQTLRRDLAELLESSE